MIPGQHDEILVRDRSHGVKARPFGRLTAALTPRARSRNALRYVVLPYNSPRSSESGLTNTSPESSLFTPSGCLKDGVHLMSPIKRPFICSLAALLVSMAGSAAAASST